MKPKSQLCKTTSTYTIGVGNVTVMKHTKNPNTVKITRPYILIRRGSARTAPLAPIVLSLIGNLRANAQLK